MPTTIDKSTLATMLRNAHRAWMHDLTQPGHKPINWATFEANYIIESFDKDQEREERIERAEAEFRATTLALI